MFLYLGIIGFLAIGGSHGQLLFPTEESCLTAWRTQGTCINLNGCSRLLELLRKPRPLSTADLETLKKSQCGFEGNVPKVCCPPETQVTPSPVVPTQLSLVETPPPDVTNHPNLRLLDNDICGPITESKIFGGNKTTVLEFPWMVLIAYVRGTRPPEFRCGGSLISKRFVLTAAHCVTELDSGLRLSGVRLGEHDLSTEQDCDIENGVKIVCAEKYQDFLIASFYAHSGYQKDKLQNDIALIKLDGDADFRPSNVRPVCLPIGSAAATIGYKKVTVTGWGATESGYRSQDLLKAKIPIVGNEECARIYKLHKVDIWYKQLCAGGANRTDSCSGDSGGPLQAPGTYINGQPKYIQYGVVSFGPRQCGIEGFPGVYTRVVYYMDWILDMMSN